MGIWTAIALREWGFAVTILDAHGLGNALSSSGGETRISRSGHGTDSFYPRWQRHSLDGWVRFAEEVGHRDLVRGGGFVWLAGDRDEHERNSASVLEALAVPFEWWTPDDLSARMPVFSSAGLAGALYEPEAVVVMARDAMRSLADHAVALGVDTRRAHVLPPGRFDVEGDQLRRIRADDGDVVAADVFVFACGPWLPGLLPGILDDEIEVTRQEVAFVSPPPGASVFDFPATPGWAESSAAVFGLGSVDHRGVQIAGDRLGIPFNPETGDRSEARDRELIQRYVRHRLPQLAERPVAEVRVCQYESTPDGHFLIDQHPACTNVWFAGGGSGHAFKHGPVIGEYVAALITEDGSRLSELRPPDDRFSLRARVRGPGFRTRIT